MSSYEKKEYTKLRRNFGKQPLFKEIPGYIVDSIYPSKIMQHEYTLRNPVHRLVQATMPQSEGESNTPLVTMQERGINHTEGGWPRDVHPYNEEHVARHRRRVMHDDGYINTVINLTPSMLRCVKQNNAIEMYETYFSNMKPQEPVDKSSIRMANVFRDEHQRPITCVKWTSEANPKLAVSYCYRLCQPDTEMNEYNYCYLWDLHRHTEPVHKIKPYFPCWQLACSPVAPEILITGLEKGIVNLFDIREGILPVLTSQVFNSHREPITSILYIYSRTQTEFFTGSTDGECLWWDTRNLARPVDRLSMSIKISKDQIPDLSNAEGVSCLEYDYGLPTRFLCGTDSGLVISANRMGKTHAEVLTSSWNSHDGPVRTVQRSKCTSRMFITCGDYTVKIWAEEVRTSPIIVTKPYRYAVTDVSWAMLRPSCYMSICAGGTFYYWDMLQKQKDPIVTLKVSDYGLTKLSPSFNGELVAIGDSRGALHLLQLSQNLVIPRDNDKARMFQIYERETKREHILDNRVKELRLKAKKEQTELSRISLDVDEQDELNEEDEERLIEEEYFRIVREQISLTGGTSLENIDSLEKLLP